MYPKEIIEALRKVTYPGSGTDIVTNGMLCDDIRIEGFKVSFSLRFKNERDPFIKSIVRASENAIHKYVNDQATIHIALRYVTPTDTSSKDENSYNHFGHIIAVHSGKGGVGKSTVTTNIAVLLAQQGYKVGLLDADIYGPSIPRMLGLEGYTPLSIDEGGHSMIAPAEVYGIKVLSIGFFVDTKQAVVWRGAMASNAISQLLNDGHWGTLDYLLIDLPPGTSDIHLTIVQQLSLDGVIVVTTPQKVACEVARRGIDMFSNEKIHVPVLGIIENLSWFATPEVPDKHYYLFGRDGGKLLSEQTGVPLWAQIPLYEQVVESGDNGSPIVLQHPYLQDLYTRIVTELCHRLSPK